LASSPKALVTFERKQLPDEEESRNFHQPETFLPNPF
jgi:hypothetical protein